MMKKVDKWQQLYDSLKQAHEVLQKELSQCKAQLVVLETERKQWELDKARQNMIIQLALNTSNAKNNEYLEEIQRLRAELKQCQSQ